MSDFYGLPSAQVLEVTTDALVSEPNTILINRVPEPGEVEVPHLMRGVRTPLSLQVFRKTGSLSTGGVSVRVDGVEVVSGGQVVGPGWTGSVQLLGGAVVAVSLSRAEAFESAQTTEVRVTYAGTLLAPYAFTWRDETPPAVLDVVAEDPHTLRIVFNEAVATDALPEHFTVRRVSRFAAEPRAVNVSKGLSAQEVLVTFDQSLTFDGAYRLLVVGVEDRYGNAIQPADGDVTFTAFSPPVPEGRRFQLWDFIPNLHKRADRDKEDLFRVVSVLQEPTNVLLYEIDRFAMLADPDLAPEPFVDAMLADLGCPLDITEMDLGDKRKVLSLLIGIYQHKGTTEGLIEAALALLGLRIQVHPLNEGGWQLGVHELGNESTTWLGPETSYQRFAFTVERFYEPPDERAMTERDRARLIELIHVMRPAHTHFRRLTETIIVPA